MLNFSYTRSVQQLELKGCGRGLEPYGLGLRRGLRFSELDYITDRVLD